MIGCFVKVAKSSVINSKKREFEGILGKFARFLKISMA